jgi:hypothetical protein
MNIIMEQQHVEENKQLYLQRVNQLYHHAKGWLTEMNLVFSTTKHLFKDELGNYHSSIMTIEDEDNTLLARLIPVGAKNLLGEGVVEIVNWVGEEHIFYMPKEGQTMVISGNKIPLLNGVNKAGWYWIEDPCTGEAHFVDKSLLLKLITLVSDYEFV